MRNNEHKVKDALLHQIMTMNNNNNFQNPNDSS